MHIQPITPYSQNKYETNFKSNKTEVLEYIGSDKFESDI